MIKYENTRGSTVRLQTAKGTVILAGFETIELSEDVHHPYFVTKTKVRKKAAPAQKAAAKKDAPKKSVPPIQETKSAKKE